MLFSNKKQLELQTDLDFIPLILSLRDTNDHNVISFGIIKNTKPNSETLYSDFCKAYFKNVNKYL